MRDFFTFAGTSSLDFGAYITDAGVQDTPRRRYSTVSIPGKSGDLILDEGSYENIELRYPVVIPHDFDRNFAGLKAFFLTHSGYQRLEDTFHPDEYRMAAYSGGIEPNLPSIGWEHGTLDLKFNCKPQRYLKNGENELDFTEDGSIWNDTQYTAKPLLRIFGTGTFGIGSETIQITSAGTYTDIDCEIMEAYQGTANRNPYVRTLSGDFPALEPGANGVQLSSGITRIVVIPRWWVL